MSSYIVRKEVLMPLSAKGAAAKRIIRLSPFLSREVCHFLTPPKKSFIKMLRSFVSLLLFLASVVLGQGDVDSVYGQFDLAAVSTDARPCAQIGT